MNEDSVFVLTKDYYHDVDSSGVELFYHRESAWKRARELINEELYGYAQTYGEDSIEPETLRNLRSPDFETQLNAWNVMQRDEMFEPRLFLYIEAQTVN